MIELTEIKENGLPLYTRCSVCHQIYVNGVGSTACCGGINECLFEHEVRKLGINPDNTRNKNILEDKTVRLEDVTVFLSSCIGLYVTDLNGKLVNVQKEWDDFIRKL